jgi:hypothetical protein
MQSNGRRSVAGLLSRVFLTVVFLTLSTQTFAMPPKRSVPSNPTLKKSAADQTRQDLKNRFLDVYLRTHFISHAAKETGVHRDTVTEWRNVDPIFAAAFNSVREDITEEYESRLRDLALGVKDKDGVLHGDTTALIFALKALSPKKYTERFRHEVTNGQQEALLSELISLIKRSLPETCPHCKTNLSLRASLAQQIIELSERLGKPASAKAV